mgnify:CR=1 FL=1
MGVSNGAKQGISLREKRKSLDSGMKLPMDCKRRLWVNSVGGCNDPGGEEDVRAIGMMKGRRE